VQTLLMLGSKSVTHSSTLLERHSPVLQKLAPTQAGASTAPQDLPAPSARAPPAPHTAAAGAAGAAEALGKAVGVMPLEQTCWLWFLRPWSVVGAPAVGAGGGACRALQVAVVASVVRLWQESPQMASILVDRCMALRIVSNLAIVDWVFTPNNLPLFHASDRVWEVGP